MSRIVTYASLFFFFGLFVLNFFISLFFKRVVEFQLHLSEYTEMALR